MTLGFIVLRHVSSMDTDRYWKLCYERIRYYYPENEIIIIDDNSNYVYVDAEVETRLYKTTVIRSLWAGRGELLPYFYYVNYGWFDNAVILHDSVFINKPIDFLKSLENIGGLGYIFLWEFEVKQDKLFMEHHHDEVRLIRRFGSSALDVLDFHSHKEEWKGCFGAMSVIQLEYLKKVNKMFRLSNLLDGIEGRFNRMSFERIIACLFQYYDKSAKGAEVGAPAAPAAAAAVAGASDGEKNLFSEIFSSTANGASVLKRQL